MLVSAAVKNAGEHSLIWKINNLKLNISKARSQNFGLCCECYYQSGDSFKTAQSLLINDN
jgi:hypothetical protein